MVKLDRIQALLSSTYANWYGASATIDGRYNTICASRWQQNAWLSVEVPPDSMIDYIAVYNRVDHASYASWLNPIEVWVGETAGDVSSASAVKCAGPVNAPIHIGETVVDSAFVVACPAGTRGSYFTIKQTGRARYLTLLEVEAYANPTSTSASTLPAAGAAKGNAGEGGDVVAVAALPALASDVPALPAYDEVNAPVTDGSTYFQLAGDDQQAVVEGGGHSAEVESVSVSIPAAVVVLSALLLVALLVVGGLLAWMVTLRRWLAKSSAHPTNTKISFAADASALADASTPTDVALVVADVENNVLRASELAPMPHGTDAMWQPVWQASSRKSSAEI